MPSLIFSKIPFITTDGSASYRILTAEPQLESSLSVSETLKSCEIWSSRCNISGTRRDSPGDTQSRLFVALLWEEIFFFIILFCISKLLASKDTRHVWISAEEGGITPHSHSLSFLYMYPEVLQWVIPEGGSATAPYRWMPFQYYLCSSESVCLRTWVQAPGSGVGGVRSGGPGWECVTQSGCDYCQPPEEDSGEPRDEEEVGEVFFSQELNE